jgi:hypothetical protein
LRTLARLAQLALALLAAGALGLAVGWLSRTGYVIALGPLVVGLAAGAAAGFAALVFAEPRAGVTRAAALLAVLAGWGALQWMDDVHFVATFREEYAGYAFADTGATDDALLGDHERALFAPDADADLAFQVREATGMDGALGRWLWRARQGVRLFGPWHASRGLAVGAAGAAVWALVELLLGWLVARAVLRRIGRLSGRPASAAAAASASASASASAGEPRDLEDEGHEEQEGAQRQHPPGL